MIRPATPDDLPAIRALLKTLDLFEADEVEEVVGLLTQHFSRGTDSPELWLVDDENSIVGIAYAAPERMTQGTWNLYLIAVHPDYQKQGRGATLLHHVEDRLRAQGKRVLLVETVGENSFEYVRSFYKKNGFDREAQIREFYAAGVDKIIFRKSLQGS
ncbi:MAG: GNAT family N-acetyltransferase [Cyanobacteria bacterium J06554_6]